MATSAIKDIPENEPMQLSAVEIQQEYFEVMGGVDWELYMKKERRYLLQKVAVALCGSPTKEGNLERTKVEKNEKNRESKDKNDIRAEKSEKLKLEGYEEREKEAIIKVFNKICEQETYSHNRENIIISVLRVVCVAPKEEVPFYKLEPADYWVNLHLKRGKDEVTICVFHVFCIRKCIATKPGAKKNCKLYIDHDARVYQDWESYLKDNHLPKSVMVVPENGEYRGVIEMNDENKDVFEMPMVKLSVCPTPALGLGAKVLSAADTASVVANVGALVGVVGAFAVPVAAPVVIPTAVGVATVTGIYGIVRSAVNLSDRKKHEQSIGLDDSEARGSWINIMVSSVGLSAGAAGKLLSWAASSGSNIKILMNAVQFLRYTNMVTGFVGVANSLGDMVYKYHKYDEKPSGLEIFQFTTSALFFGIGVMSNQTAQDIVKDAQAKSINEMRDSLSSNTKRKIFDKVTAETRRLEGHIKGNSDIIRALKTIENKDDFFAKLNRINKQVNKNKVRISLTSDGATLINNQHKVGVNDLYGLGKKGQNELFSKYGPAKVTTKNAPTRIYPSNTSASNKTANTTNELNIYLRSEELIKITTYLIQLSKYDQDLIAEILSQMTYTLHDTFLLLCAELLASLTPGELNDFEFIDRNYKVKIALFLFDQLKKKLHEIWGDCDVENDNAWVIVAKKFIINGGIDKDTILILKDRFIAYMFKKKHNKNNDPNNFDEIYEFRKTYQTGFKNLRAGEVIEIGNHAILVKGTTIEYLEGSFNEYSQAECDFFIEFCFKIISMLTEQQIDDIILINPDEDIIMRVAHFLINLNIIKMIINKFVDMQNIDENNALIVKNDLLIWRSKQNTRKHKKCSLCAGMRYVI